MASRRPQTSASSRPTTSASDVPGFSPHYDGGAAAMHRAFQEQEEWDDESDSEEEGLFAYLPPGAAVATPSSTEPASPATPNTGTSMLAPPSTGQSMSSYRPHTNRTRTGLQSIAETPEKESLSRAGSSDDLHMDDAVGSDAYRLRTFQVPSTGASSTHQSSVHVSLSLPRKNSANTDGGKRASSEFADSAVDAIDDLPPGFKVSIDIQEEVDEDSPYPEVRASVSNIDDVTMPALTFRTWVMGLFFVVLASGLNGIFHYRQPAPVVYPLVILLLSYPVGRFMAFALPIHVWRLPRWLGGGSFSFNPGPFNVKEHVLMYIMCNVSIGIPYAMKAIVVAEINYGIRKGFWFNLVLVLATQMTGFGLAGFCRRFLVWPASMIWPQNLVASSLINTLHSQDDRWTGGITRYRFFVYAFVGSFCFFFLPGYLFTALSAFSWVCWIAPRNVPVNQLFGVESGLGLGLISFDWSTISWIGSPLMVPWWAQLHVFSGFVVFYWILCPILYYSNTWNMAHFPMLSNSPYDRFGQPYNLSAILGPDGLLNATAYDEYSPLYLPAAWIVTYWLAFSMSTAVLVHTALYHGKSLMNGLKNMRVEKDDIHAKLMRQYPEVPDWWYLIATIIFFGMAVLAVENWHTPMPWWGLLLSLAIAIVYILPGGFIYAMTGQPITLNIVAQTIGGTVMPGNAFANMIFKTYAIQTQVEAQNFVQALKLGHYVKVPPRATFIAQAVATIVAGFVQVAVKTWMFENVADICSPTQPDNFTCPHNQVFLSASIIWGVVGPARQFGKGTMYNPELFALLFGAILPVPFWLWQRKFPKSWVKLVSVPVILNGVNWIPPATGINYSSWFVVGTVFQYFFRRRHFAWWSKFNYVLSAALDSGTIISILVIFFALQLPKGIEQPQWWGTTVFKNTADYDRTPIRTTPPEGIPL
ncbi:OPT-domain-containing protein [Auriculariales sp. MPI-PUGE-AT-0066]|nr:OPT-domain-containing protein [Auriculariales sp. MPI-PUGE-AT-0066]